MGAIIGNPNSRTQQPQWDKIFIGTICQEYRRMVILHPTLLARETDILIQRKKICYKDLVDRLQESIRTALK